MRYASEKQISFINDLVAKVGREGFETAINAAGFAPIQMAIDFEDYSSHDASKLIDALITVRDTPKAAVTTENWGAWVDEVTEDMFACLDC